MSILDRIFHKGPMLRDLSESKQTTFGSHGG